MHMPTNYRKLFPVCRQLSHAAILLGHHPAICLLFVHSIFSANNNGMKCVEVFLLSVSSDQLSGQ